MKVKSVIGTALASVSAIMMLSNPLVAEDSQQNVMVVCQNTGEKAGMEGAVLSKFVAQCSDEISGLNFSSDDPVPGEEVARIEERCIDDADSEEEEAK